MRRMITGKQADLFNHVVQNGNTTEVGGHLEVDGNLTVNGEHNLGTVYQFNKTITRNDVDEYGNYRISLPRYSFIHSVYAYKPDTSDEGCGFFQPSVGFFGYTNTTNDGYQIGYGTLPGIFAVETFTIGDELENYIVIIPEFGDADSLDIYIYYWVGNTVRYDY